MNPDHAPAPTHQPEAGQPPRSMKKIAAASVIGTTVEWYDLFIFATASALVFNKVFFPAFDPLTGTLLAFGTFASAYVARILGAALFGHFGDKVGRKSMLLISLIMMGSATFAIGLLPDYRSIGIWAPILLLTLRVIQGLALGGEWGGAVLMAVEHAPADKRGLYGSWVQIGVPAGTLIANLAFLLCNAVLSNEALLSWGWRIPFLASVLLVGVGMYIRLNTSETPSFSKVKATAAQVKIPLMEVLTKSWKQVLLGGIATMSTGTAFNLIVAFGLTYGTQTLGFSRNQMLTIALISCALCVVLLPLFGLLSDKVGRKPVIIGGIIAEALLAFPLFWLLDTKVFSFALLGYLLMMSAFAANYGPIATFLAELFGTKVRYSGLSISYMLSGLLGSAATPIITTALLSATGRGSSVAWYMIGSALISAAALLLLAETLRKHAPAASASGVDATTSLS
ncbi:MFS transporter [Cupriavidus sp. CuC1]|uniref:MFS transporter n=1 Tax=Cupriavidus sp. CuC1 TaxID=3373131 RepID=UPI0037D49E75